MKHYKVQDFKDDVDNYSSVIRITDFEHFFNVYEDKKRGKEAYNLNATLYFSADPATLLSMTLQHTAYWPQISYMVYSTPRLAWLLMKLNGVKAGDMFKPVQTGTKVVYVN